MTYWAKLQDPRWQRTRLTILERDGFKCRECKAGDKTLHVHHAFYEGSAPWETSESFLLTLCADCHERRGFVEKDTRRMLATIMAWMTIEQLDQLQRSIEEVGMSHCRDVQLIGFQPKEASSDASR